MIRKIDRITPLEKWGTVHYIQEHDDLQWVLSDGPHTPYVAVLNGANFTGVMVEMLLKSGRINGIMVINHLNGSNTPSIMPPDGFSSVDSCPNDRSGLYGNETDYKDCQKVTWNPMGSGLHFQDISIPIFALSLGKDVDYVLNKCYYPFNEPIKKHSRSFPVCAAEVKSSMDGAVDSVTCLRRTNRFALSFSPQTRFCDPIGDHNIAVTMKDHPQNETRPEESVIVVAAKMDSTSLFYNEYRASDTTVSGLVTLLATAEALWKVKDVIQQEPDAKDIMFTFLQGETFDYIGSSRMVYDMIQGNFPSAYDHRDTLYLPKVNLTHLNQIVEVNQVGRRDDGDSLWAHTDPLGLHVVSDKVESMIKEIEGFGQQVDLKVQRANQKLPLPPASAQSFLRERLDIPVVVLTDHQKGFTNKYYNSRLDMASLIKADDYPAGSNASVQYDFVTTQARLIANLSTSLARYLYNASMGQAPEGHVAQNLTADPSTITHLLYCFLISPNCELFLESVDSEDKTNSLKTAKQPYSFYVSVDRHTSEITHLVYAILARLTGERILLSKDKCTQPAHDKRFTYVWMRGALKDPHSGSKEREGWCYRSTMFETDAVSPAFVIDDYDFSSGRYSTWAESTWGDQAIGVRLFLLPSQLFEASVLLVGLGMLAASLVLVYYCHARSDLIFDRGVQGGLLYNPIM